MGNSVVKIKKSHSQVLADIKEINKITTNKFFERRVGFLIEFKSFRQNLSCFFVKIILMTIFLSISMSMK
jgi:hypothetical protein